jgi:alpha-mannosidase
MPGDHEFEYSIVCYNEASVQANRIKAIQQARYFSAPLRTEITGIHPGMLPADCQLIHSEPDTFEISAIKQAEDGSGWIVRGYNPLPEPIEVILRPWRQFSKVMLARLDETNLGNLPTDSNGAVKTTLGAHSILTLKFSD